MDETTEQERLLDYQRARFEEFAVSQGMHGILQGADRNGFYHSNTVNFAHKVWRAAEAPLLERIKELERRLAEANTSAELALKCASTLLAGGEVKQ